MAMTYIINGKIVLPDAVVTGKALAYDTESGNTISFSATVTGESGGWASGAGYTQE